MPDGRAVLIAGGASGTVRALIQGEVTRSGVWMPEQVMSPPGFFAHLAKHGLAVQVSAVDDTHGQVAGRTVLTLLRPRRF